MHRLIFGFITKEDAEKLLLDYPSKSFIVRFSERRAGKLAVAFSRASAATRKEIKHYLIDPPDTKTFSLPEFLRNHIDFMFLLKLKTDFMPTNGLIDSPLHKDEALKEFYTKRSNQTPAGYEPCLS
jgi:hypothetical protein